MPLTELDTTAALIVIDLQKGVVALPTAHPVTKIIANLPNSRGLSASVAYQCSCQRDGRGSGPD
jgi:hypothetical protein